MNRQSPDPQLKGPNGDLQRVLETLEAVIIRLIENPETIAFLRERAEARIAINLEERINSYSSLAPWVRESWPMFVEAHVGVPLLEHLVSQLIEDDLLISANVDDVMFSRRQDALVAFGRVLVFAASGDSDVARVRARIDEGLRAFRLADREWRWENELGDDS